MSVASELTRIKNAKNDLKSSINAKTDAQHQITNETIDEYADFVDSISSGSGNNNNVLVDTDYASTYSYSKGITSLITSIDVIDLKYLTNLRGFLATSKITTFPLIDTSQVTTMREMFSDCPLLENVPILNTSSVTTMLNMFANVRNLTDTSLDNILQMCININPDYLRGKTLSELGFGATNYPASRIQALPHYQDFINAGWTIGY